MVTGRRPEQDGERVFRIKRKLLSLDRMVVFVGMRDGIWAQEYSEIVF